MGWTVRVRKAVIRKQKITFPCGLQLVEKKNPTNNTLGFVQMRHKVEIPFIKVFLLVSSSLSLTCSAVKHWTLVDEPLHDNVGSLLVRRTNRVYRTLLT